MLINETGASIGQTDIRVAESINTAFQLLAVYFQIQSQEQFGGVAASHLDFTMVTPLRKTFTKRICDGIYYLEKEKRAEWLGEESLNLSKDEFKKFFKNWIKENDDYPDNLLHLDDVSFQKKHPEAWEYAYDATVDELTQSVEALYHNLNSLQSRSGGQLPFTSLNYGLCTSPEGRLIIKALLEGSLAGTGKHHATPIFPCGIFQVKDGVNKKEGDPNYDLFRLALKSTSKRIYPNYANCDFSGQRSWVNSDRKTKEKIINDLNEEDYNKLVERLKNDKSLQEKLTVIVTSDNTIKMNYNELPLEVMSTMGCRTQNGYDINFGEIYEDNIKSVIENGTLKHPYFLSGAQKDGRGNICPQTIILPTLAMEALEDNEIEDLRKGIISGNQEKKVDKFMRILSRKIDQTKDSLIDRFNWISAQGPESAPFMWKNGTMVGFKPEEGIRSALKHGTLAMGQLALNEALMILIGKNHTTEEGLELAKRIERLFRRKCNDYKEEYKLNFGVYYTPKILWAA